MHVASNEHSTKATSVLLTLMMVFSSLLLTVSPTVQAVGANQNDLNSGGDLPDNTSVGITNYIFSGSYSGNGELDYGDDNDIIRVALNANQGLAATLSFPSSTTFSNGTTVNNQFQLGFYNNTQSFMGLAGATNPVMLTTNGSISVPHDGMVYVNISRATGSGSWSLTLYKFTVSGTGGGGSGGSSSQGPPGAGTTNLTVLNTTYLSGNQSYDDLYIGCGIVSCGSIVATGDLILSVNTLTVMNGASIIAYDQPTNLQGVGGSEQMSASYIGNGGGGAGHTSSGGNGGSSSSSGTVSNSGSSFGSGNETGSNGGSVTDSSFNTISAGGIGGGRIVIYADVIEIYGTVDASGQDGEQGYTYQNGSGNGGSGAGAGSGGSIIMRANEVTVGGSSGGSILAEGGNGGDGADGFCAPGSACIGLYHGGQGGGGGSGGAIDIRANSAANLMISSTSTISSSGGIGGSGGAPYGTGSSGSAGSSGGSGTANSGTWTGWSSSNPPPPTTSLPNPCIGAGTNAAGNIVADALEVNDAQSTASPASILPVSCTDLSLHSSTDVDFFEVQLVTGVTYYVNVTFSHAIQDVDVGWDDVNGSFLAAGTSVSDNELLTFTATQNVTSYVEVFPYIGFGGTTNPITYNITIETDNPGGGQSLELAYVNIVNSTNATVSFAGLQSNTTYNYTTVLTQSMIGNTSVSYSLGNGTFNSSNSSTYSFGVNYTLENNQSTLEVLTLLYDANGNLIATGFDELDIDMLAIEATSSTTGEINLTNLSIGTDYDLQWMVFDDSLFYAAYLANNNSVYAGLNASVIDGDVYTFTAQSETRDFNITWAGPTTSNFHGFVAVLSVNGTVINLENNENFSAFGDDFFIPQLPSIIISSVSSSVNSTTNDVTTRGLDLVVGDTYKYRIKILDSGNATVAQSPLTTVTATYQGMSFGTWNYTTPTASGTYCALAELYEADGTQRIGDLSCFTLTFDSDFDGVANELDQCPSSPAGSLVDQYGCAPNQRDTDGDGVNDDVDQFVNDSSQWTDQDGDGYGDNPTGNNSDAFPSDSTQWSDQDGDGYGDNPNGTYPDAFPTDSTQWNDMDGDGYGDNPAGNNADLWTNDSSQWFDSDGDGYGDNPTGTNGDAFPNDATQWSDQDGDGYGDNQSGTNPDAFPADATQWADSDGDGYGDNRNGNNGDRFPTDGTQWSDQDNDGYGDNQAGNNPDAFPTDGTQWSDADGDGYGDNQGGKDADRFPNDNTQWSDIDGDGYGDNANGNNPDLCPNTPFGQTVDSTGCSDTQLDDDGDGVSNNLDVCPNTPAGETVNFNGCSDTELDGDLDGVKDAYDDCVATPLGSTVDATGCADSEKDTDGDGITDDIDQCPSTPTGSTANVFGCSAEERDQDSDMVADSDDLCGSTPAGENVDANGCSDTQKDGDNDGVSDAVDTCAGTAPLALVDENGCSSAQLDDDIDGVYNNKDICPATPAGEAPDADGCGASQLDDDGDTINNAFDLCPMTNPDPSLDANGCVSSQRDTDMDGVTDNRDDCPATNMTSIADDDGCALEQYDSDNDGYNDRDDAFPLDPQEWEDSDGDGVPNKQDAYPDDPTQTKAEAESGGGGFLIYTLVAILVLGALAGLGVMRRNSALGVEKVSPFSQEPVIQGQMETQMLEQQASNESTGAETGSQEWEENGVRWLRQEDGSLFYLDPQANQWIAYEQSQ